MTAEALKWVGGVDGFLELIDQRKLPDEVVKVQCREVEALYEAIVTLTVRGAPAIGVAGAYGPVLALQKLGAADDLQKALSAINRSCEYLASARPTGVNLSWALDRVRKKAEEFVAGKSQAKLRSLPMPV
jgi:methylthioribose-1-phosphate isomerase